MAIKDLQSENHRDLLDVVDKLRSQGLSRYVDLPEIIVCGDQSAGKSSVLEAISGMSFPTKDNLCTRFATELILRRDPSESIRISITPVDDRDQGEKEIIAQWRPQASIELDGLVAVIEEAKGVMGLTTTKAFSNDILRVELSGPTQPHLTMVDLPGLFRAGNKEQSADNVELVRRMVTRYMKRPRSIILAVVSAKTEYVLQEVTVIAKKADPQGQRTMGLITKPDTLDVGSESERSWIGLAANENVELKLGWHVLKNRSYEQREFSSAERDKDEEEFFSKGAWANVEPMSCGVKSLKSRLSHVLKEQILKQLPSLVADVEQGIASCNAKLSKLGDARESPEQQRRYLMQISGEFTTLMIAAIQGDYQREFFLGAHKFDGYSKRLRAVVQNKLEAFAKDMHENGQSLIIVDTEGSEQVYGDRSISRSDYIDDVKEQMKYSRGRELPGLFNPAVVDRLFSKQCGPWKGIVRDMTDDVLEDVRRATRHIVEQTAAEDVAEKLLMLLNEKIDEYKANVDRKVEELLQPHYNQHAITYNHQLTLNVQTAQKERKEKLVEKRIRETYGLNGFPGRDNPTLKATPAMFMGLYLDEFETDMGRFGASLAVDYMEAYYKVAFDRFIDDISVNAIEGCLISKLPLLITSNWVLELNEADTKALVGESEETALTRTKLDEKLGLLQKGLQDIKRFQTHRDVDVSAAQASPPLPEEGEDLSEVEVESIPGTPVEAEMPVERRRSVTTPPPVVAYVDGQPIVVSRRRVG